MKLSSLSRGSTALLATALVLVAGCNSETQPTAPLDPELVSADATPVTRTLCTPGAVQACAKVEITIGPVHLGTGVRMKVWNMQGSHPMDNTGGSSLRIIDIFVNKANFDWFPQSCAGQCRSLLQVVGNVILYGDSTAGPFDVTYYDRYDPTFTYAELLMFNTPFATGFFGCSVGPFPKDDAGVPTPNAFATCPALGHDGYLEWRFATKAIFKPIDFGLTLDFQLAGGSSVRCTWRGQFASNCINAP